MGCFSNSSVRSRNFDPAWLDAPGEKQELAAATPEELITRLNDLKREVGDAKVDWYVVPSEDEHQSEEIGESDERRSWISGFTGSAGTALIPADSETKALLFVDSRYWIQAEQQAPKAGWDVVRVGATGESGRDGVVGGWLDWVVEAEEGLRIGIDPKLIALSAVNTLKSRLEDSSTKLVPLKSNLIDRIHSPPSRSLESIVEHPLQFSGETTPSKLKRVRKSIDHRFNGRNADWIYVLPTLPAIAWLLSIRCPGDIPYVPVAYAYVVLTMAETVVFVDQRKISGELGKKLEEDGVDVRDYGVDEVGKYVQSTISDLRAEDEKRKVKVLAPKECSWALSEACGGSVEIVPCPVDILKGVKNATEQQGMRDAYLRDGRAMIRWFSWLEGKLLKENRQVGEWAAAQGLLRFRRQEDRFAGLAYGDISASGPNGALPHYAPQRGTDRVIDLETTYVIDSGGQYLDGTIDTTRTWFFGKSPTDDMKRAYTRVLQCHIAASTAIFPEGMSGDKLVMLGKAALYQDGLDYGHGLGHGIGTYLAVHEYPIYPNGTSFEPGHITSIEPGFYKEGEWGIRTESVYICKKVETMYDFGGKRWLSWDRITQVPIQTNLVDWSLMSKPEIRWLNDHNKAVEDTILPLLDPENQPGDDETRDWLKRVCKPKKIWPWTGA